MGVCCIVFDIDGMLFEFFMNFFNIEKYKNFIFIFFQNLMFSSRFMLFPKLKTKLSKKFRGGGGGGVLKTKFCLENNSFSFHVLYYFEH